MSNSRSISAAISNQQRGKNTTFQHQTSNPSKFTEKLRISFSLLRSSPHLHLLKKPQTRTLEKALVPPPKHKQTRFKRRSLDSSLLSRHSSSNKNKDINFLIPPQTLQIANPSQR
eukprot:TRINITY_DN14397_c0_g1_i1.p1 TRINITY_DN14397_c0_g1~~TRINITY_DN14397_c0_g1_i1.p1  ORF type:complete len:115 (-),score=15.26 TRINITY_DN14397_c0_g1_i1:272-616(-)